MAAAYTRNREHLAPYDPLRHPSFFTVRGQEQNVRGQLRAHAEGTMEPLVVVLRGEGVDAAEQIVGRVALNNIVRGVLQSASVGYWVDRDHLGRGVAAGAVAHAVRRATELGLHRLEAGTMLDNIRSQAVLRRCGFSEYGVAEQFLFIAGQWRDHVLFQRILGDAPARVVSRP